MLPSPPADYPLVVCPSYVFGWNTEAKTVEMQAAPNQLVTRRTENPLMSSSPLLWCPASSPEGLPDPGRSQNPSPPSFPHPLMLLNPNRSPCHYTHGLANEKRKGEGEVMPLRLKNVASHISWIRM